jgi:hypothetical protein
MSSRLLSINLESETYKTVILLVVLHGCVIWAFTLMQEYRLRVFNGKVLREILELKRKEVPGGWTRLHNEELYNLYSSPNTRVYPKVSGLSR